jgi:hypothetical protein
LNTRRVSFTLTARRHVEQQQAWWRENRDYPELFAEELDQALKIIAMLPGAGTLYAQSPIPGIRRVLPQTGRRTSLLHV